MDLLVATMAPQYLSRWQRGEQMIKTDVSSLIQYVLFNCVSIFAAWLSWTCSTEQGLTLLPKVAWAGGAYFLGFFYIIFYAFKHRHACALAPVIAPVMQPYSL